MSHMVTQMNKYPTAVGSELLKQTSVLDAIFWLHNSWNEVEESTILKCFKRCGFKFSDIDQDSELDDSDDDVPLATLKLTRELFDIEFSELVKIDNDIRTSEQNENVDWDQSSAQDLL